MRFNKLILRAVAFSLLLMASQSVFAVVILNFSPNSQTVLLSGQASVDIVASNLQNEFIGEFDFIASWDSSILSLANVSFGSLLGDGTNSIQSEITDNVAGSSILAEVSFLSSADLFLSQPGTGNFILATLVFDTLTVGLSDLTLTQNISGGGFLGDGGGLLLAANANPGSINVVAASVPEPGTLFLIGIGLLTILTLRQRAKM